ncbi:hypothetical protein, conserved in T. vivax, partial [Trypanosoma vivax Y486]
MPLGRGGAMRSASVLRPVRLSGRVARASGFPVLHAPTAVFPSEFMSGTPRTVHFSLLGGCGREAEQRLPCDEATFLAQRLGGHPPLLTCQDFRAPAPCSHNACPSATVAPSAATLLAGGARSRQRRTADCEGRAPTRARRRMPPLRNSYAVCVAERRAAHGRTGRAPRVVGEPADGQLGPDTSAGAAHRAHRVCSRRALAQNERRGGARGGDESTRGRRERAGEKLAEARDGARGGKGRGRKGNARGRVDSTVGSHNWRRAPCRMRRQGTERGAGGANLRPVRGYENSGAQRARSKLGPAEPDTPRGRGGGKAQDCVSGAHGEHQRGAVAGALHGRARRRGTHRGFGRGNRDTRRELGTDHRQLQPKVGRHGAPERPHRRHIDHGRLWNRTGVHHRKRRRASDFLRPRDRG